MADYRCRSGDTTWQTTANTATATSVSPDRVVGRGHSGGGPWAGKAENPVLWNSGGSVYGCWF